VIQREQAEIVTVVAAPPPEAEGPLGNPFIDDVVRMLAPKQSVRHRVIRAASVLDIDIGLDQVTRPPFHGRVRLQIIGHSVSGILSLGNCWLPEATQLDNACRYPFYALDTTPAALGLLAKYVGKISEVLLVGCNIGSASSFGYAVNGRTLTYTLTELFQCTVRGADDIVGADEFDQHGWYSPGQHSRRPKGWRWIEDMPPTWIDPGTDSVRYHRASTVISFEVQAITGTALPVPRFDNRIVLEPTIQLACRQFDGPKPPSALAEVSLDTDQGPAQLLCGGRFLRVFDTYYIVEKQPQLSALLTEKLWRAPASELSAASSLDEPAPGARKSTHYRR